MALDFVQLDQAIIGLQDAIVTNMRRSAPKDTGALRRSIRPEKYVDTPQGIQAPISFLNYGAIQNSPYGKHTGWIDSSIDRAIAAQENAIADAGVSDITQFLDKTFEQSGATVR